MENFVGKYIKVISAGFGRAEFIFKLGGIKGGYLLCGDAVCIKSPVIKGLFDGDEFNRKIIGLKAIKTIREATREEIETLKH